jgi:hypothetical protein
MATIKLQGSASGSGSVILTSPNTNATRTVTLPDADMNLGDIGGEGSIAAWVNWNQTGTVAILADGGVSSLTDNGTGLATISFSSSKSSINYGFNGAVNTYYTSTRWDVHCIERAYTLHRSTSSIPINMGYGGYAERDFARATGVITE